MIHKVLRIYTNFIRNFYLCIIRLGRDSHAKIYKFGSFFFCYQIIYFCGSCVVSDFCFLLFCVCFQKKILFNFHKDGNNEEDVSLLLYYCFLSSKYS